MKKSANPWYFVPSTYFAEGLPYVVVNTLVVVLYKKLNIPNDVIAFLTSWLFLPWTIKFLWGPVVDIVGTKRKWIIYTELAMAALAILASISLGTKYFLATSLTCFMIMAFLSATQDIAVDGFYMISMDDKKQAFFVGIRSFFYRLAMLFSSSVLIIYAGRLESMTNNVVLSWQTIIVIVALIMGLLFLYHTFVLPFPDADSSNKKFNWHEFWDAIISFFKQDKIWLAIAFILLYRFGEAVLLKITPLFMLDSVANGGLGLPTADYGMIYGTVGLIFLILGNILGGFAIAKWGLKKCIWPMALLLNIPDLVYVYMAYHTNLSIGYVYVLVSLEQFGYGVGTTAFMYYLIQICGEKYKTTHFAVATSIMNVGLMIPGMFSGKLQMAVGYPKFFIIACLLTIPGMILIPFLKIKE